MTEKTITVPAIHCDHCRASIEGAVGALGGVDAVRVDVPDRTVFVRYDDAQASEELIVAAIEDQGYEVPK